MLKPKRVNFTKTWNVLQETVKGVITLGNVPRAVWNDRFSDVYSLCVAYPEPLADRLYQETEAFLDSHVRGLLVDVQSQGERNLLRAYHSAWMEYSHGIYYLHQLYLYLNEHHIKKQKLSEVEIMYGNYIPDPLDQMEIGELGLDIWKRNMIEPLWDSLGSLLLDGIEQDRVWDAPLHVADTIPGIIQSFISVEEYKKTGNLELYKHIFEERFLKANDGYYEGEASRLVEECDVSGYMECVVRRLEAEARMCLKFLHSSSFVKVRAQFDLRMVADHLPFLHGECAAMVKGERRKDLWNMYILLRPIQWGLPPLVDALLEHVQQQGLQAVGNLRGENVHIQFVKSMLGVYQKYKDFIEDVFSGDQCFMGALDKACNYVINHRLNRCRSPELLAKYCDSLLKKSSKGISESEIDEKLSRSIIIFKYMDDKDVFLRFYSKMLAKRLIHQQNHSMDAEESMINRLQQACGSGFMNKLHLMFTDISLSADQNNKFSEFLKKGDIELGINVSVYVLQAGVWPFRSLTSLAVPQELEKSVQMFENFYRIRFHGIKLTWLHHLCHGELKLNYLSKPYIVTVQTFQMAILLLFERTDSLTHKELQTTLQLNCEHFSKNLASLLDSKILLCDTAENMGPDSVLQLNLNYSNKRTKFRITSAVQRESPQETEATLSAVDEDRKLYLEAAIVRIMKWHKVHRHNALIQEVLSQSKATFTPSIGMIKKCIETLIDKQYIERTPNSTDEYSYVA